jgi:hypothetical protein
VDGANQDTALASAPPSSDDGAATTIPPTRSPLPGETPATPMAQLLADRQQNAIVRDSPNGDGLPPGLVEGERAFAAEPVDATWAPGAEANILARFAQMPGLELIDLRVECRSTMCRFELTQPTGLAARGGANPLDILRDDFGLTPRWMMSVVERPGAPTVKSIAYLWRDGHALRECDEDGRRTPCVRDDGTQ